MHIPNPIEFYGQKYEDLSPEDKYKYDILMCKGKKRRCNCCHNTYTWNYNLLPEEVEDMALNVELMNRKLVCSWMCYFKYVGRFVRKLEFIKRTPLWNTAFYYHSHISISPRYMYPVADDTALDYNYAFVKEDQEHFQ